MQMLKAYAKDFWRYRYLLQNLIGGIWSAVISS